MMISKVRGTFGNFSGTFEIDENNPENTSIFVEIESDSINTRQTQRDNHLRSEDFFNVSEYPKLVFTSTSVDLSGKSEAILNGDLTIKEITRPVSLQVVYNGLSKSSWGAESTGFSAETKINRKDWVLIWNQGLETGGFLVGDKLTGSIEMELIKQPRFKFEFV